MNIFNSRLLIVDFNSRLSEYYDEHAPLQRVLYKKLPAPWLTDDIRKQMRVKDRLRRIWRRNRKRIMKISNY